jgi:hypothetical protein
LQHSKEGKLHYKIMEIMYGSEKYHDKRMEYHKEITTGCEAGM